MKLRRKHQILTFFIATVWLMNGLVCKVLNFVPRHQDIVARIAGTHHTRFLTSLIGISEIIMALWILSGSKSQTNAITQILIIAAMNTLELILAPDLLLWGRANAFFAFLFILLIYYNEFQLNKKLTVAF
jgi:DoxX-like family